MDKIAMIKIAEVNGALAALAELGVVKIASSEDFDVIADAIADRLPDPDQYDMNLFLDKTAEVMGEVEAFYGEGGAEQGSEKTAEELHRDEMAYFGELVMAKEAGEISEEDFYKEAAKLDAAKAFFKAFPDKAKGGVDYLKRGFKGEGVKDAAKKFRESGSRALKNETPEMDKAYKGYAIRDAKDLGKALGRTGVAYGTAGAGLGGAAYGGKKLYDSRKK